MGGLVVAEIDTTAITKVLADLGTAGGVVVAAGIAVGAAIFGLLFLWRKARSAVSS